MKSVMERRIINGRKPSKEETTAAKLSIKFVKQKYDTATFFFYILRRLKIIKEKTFPFDNYYLADRLTQQQTFGNYKQYQLRRGAGSVDFNNIVTCPTWFLESEQHKQDE